MELSLMGMCHLQVTVCLQCREPFITIFKSQFTQLGAKASLTMNLKDHELKLGYEFEKLTSRAFGLSPVALWTLMRQNANSHINELDLDNPIFVGYDTIRYERLVNLEAQSTFDRNLRSSLGMDPNGMTD
jgi:hypothetical protein